jgi:hypothetical protein
MTNTLSLFFGLFLLNLHILSVKNKNIKRIFTFTDVTFYILVLSFLTNNNYLYPIAISLCISVLIGKTFVLQKYTISGFEDFVIHYLTVLISLGLLVNRKYFKYNIYYLLGIMIFMLGMNYVYKTIRKKEVYKSVNFDNLNGKIKLIGQSLVTLLIYKFIRI